MKRSAKKQLMIYSNMNNEDLTLHAGDDDNTQEERDESDYYPNTREDE